MKYALVILSLMTVVACQEKEAHQFCLSETGISKIDLSHGVVIQDSLGYFSFQVPDSQWRPNRSLDSRWNTVTVGDSSQGFIRLFNIVQSNYDPPFKWEEEQQKVQEEYDLIEKGFIELENESIPYHLVHDEDNAFNAVSCYMTILDSMNYRLYTLCICVEYAEKYEERIGEMMPIVASFQLENNK